MPYWPTIQKLAKHNKGAPGGNPETVKHHNPPAYRIKEIFEIGKCRESYVKPRDAARISRENDLSVAVAQCSELKAMINTILSLCGGPVMSMGVFPVAEILECFSAFDQFLFWEHPLNGRLRSV